MNWSDRDWQISLAILQIVAVKPIFILRMSGSAVNKVLENASIRDMLNQVKWYVSKADSITRLFTQNDYDYYRDKCLNMIFWERENALPVSETI